MHELYNILRFNEKIEFMPLVKHILTKIWKYKNNSNIKLNIKSILNMKGEKSDENIEIKDYNLSKINTDNEIDFSLYNNENKSSSNKNSPNDKEEKMGLNYSLIIKNIMDDIKDNNLCIS